MPVDEHMIAWLKDCLERARENVPYTREHFPEHELEAVAEQAFFQAAVAFAMSGVAAPRERVRPDPTVVATVLDAAARAMSRAQEELDNGRLTSSAVQQLLAHQEAWTRLREFVEEY